MPISQMGTPLFYVGPEGKAAPRAPTRQRTEWKPSLYDAKQIVESFHIYEAKMIEKPPAHRIARAIELTTGITPRTKEESAMEVEKYGKRVSTSRTLNLDTYVQMMVRNMMHPTEIDEDLADQVMQGRDPLKKAGLESAETFRVLACQAFHSMTKRRLQGFADKENYLRRYMESYGQLMQEPKRQLAEAIEAQRGLVAKYHIIYSQYAQIMDDPWQSPQDSTEYATLPLAQVEQAQLRVQAAEESIKAARKQIENQQDMYTKEVTRLTRECDMLAAVHPATTTVRVNTANRPKWYHIHGYFQHTRLMELSICDIRVYRCKPRDPHYVAPAGRHDRGRKSTVP